MSTVELSVPRSLDARQSIISHEIPAPSDAGWWRFLARWSLFAALNGVVGWAIFLYVSAQGVNVAGNWAMSTWRCSSRPCGARPWSSTPWPGC